MWDRCIWFAQLHPQALGFGMSISKDITHDGKSWVSKGSRWSINRHYIRISDIDHIAMVALRITEEI